jgi:hypothetical protein
MHITSHPPRESCEGTREWEGSGARQQLALALLAVPAHVSGGDAAHDLGQRQAAALAALALPAQQRAQQAALVCEPPLILLPQA